MNNVIIDWELVFAEAQLSYSRSSGPGGQHVNKTDSKATLHWCPASSRALPEDCRERLLRSPLVQGRLTVEGELVITAQENRSQDLNRQAALDKLRELVQEAIKKPKRRVPTRPGRGARERRLEGKRQRAKTKSSRSWKGD